MTRDEALKLADTMLEELIKSGDEALFAAATINGKVDRDLLVQSAMRARERIADAIMKEEE